MKQKLKFSFFLCLPAGHKSFNLIGNFCTANIGCSLFIERKCEPWLKYLFYPDKTVLHFMG